MRCNGSVVKVMCVVLSSLVCNLRLKLEHALHGLECLGQKHV